MDDVIPGVTGQPEKLNGAGPEPEVNTSPGAMDGPDTPEREDGEFRERLTVLEEQLMIQRHATALVTLALVVGCIVAAAYLIRSARARTTVA